MPEQIENRMVVDSEWVELEEHLHRDSFQRNMKEKEEDSEYEQRDQC